MTGCIYVPPCEGYVKQQKEIERLLVALREASQIATANTKQPGDLFAQISKACRKGFGQ